MADLSSVSKLELGFFNQMIDSSYNALVEGKHHSNSHTCKYIIEKDTGHSLPLPPDFNPNNTIILSTEILERFHPLFTYLYSTHPNIAKDAMFSNCLECLKILVGRLAYEGYSIIIKDSIYDLAIVQELLYILKIYGYNTELLVLKNGLYSMSLDNLKAYIISLILSADDSQIDFKTIPLGELISFLNSELINSMLIKDNFLITQIGTNKGGTPLEKIGINPSADTLEPLFNKRMENLRIFASQNYQFLTGQNYEDIQKKIALLESSYYDSIDISFFTRSRSQ